MIAMTKRTVLVVLTAALSVASSRPAAAASAGDAGAALVVPYVELSSGPRTRATNVFVENHESLAAQVQLRWVGEGSSSSPGLRICGNRTLAGGSLTRLDYAAACSLSGTDDRGMLILLATSSAGLARLSARADMVLLGGGSLTIDGLPLASLVSTETVHVVTGLPLGSTIASGFTTDCLFGTFFDGSGSGGSLVRFGLRDGDDQPLGRDVLLAVKPFSLTRFEDVARLVGAPPNTPEIRAVFSPAGGGDAVVGYCLSQAATPKGQTLAYSLAQVDEPLEETRRRSVSVASTPEVQGGAAFQITPTESTVFHGVFLRHPDTFSCGVAAADALVLAVVPPDGATRIGGTSNTTGRLDTGVRGSINAGVAGFWGLEVSWDPGARRTAPVTYTISCRSGNGSSLADELFRR
jgi:hypothetical protein